MDVGKIQRLSETHENLNVFFRICCVSGVELSVNGQGHSQSLDHPTTGLILLDLRKVIKTKLDSLADQIKEEVRGGN